MRHRKQERSPGNCAPAAKNRFQPHKDERLQNELLQERPDGVLPRPMPWQRLRRTKASCQCARCDDGQHENRAERENNPCSRKWLRQAKFTVRAVTGKGEEDREESCCQTDRAIEASLRHPHGHQDQPKNQPYLQKIALISRTSLPFGGKSGRCKSLRT